MPRVLFVSKPIAPPFHDGTKCLVRDVASELRDFSPVVMTTKNPNIQSQLDYMEAELGRS